MNDQLLAFEHALRAHVNAALKRCEEFDNGMGEYNRTWTLDYDAADGGAWKVIPPYNYRISGVLKAAALDDALNIAFNACSAARAARNLPAMLGHDKDAVNG